MECKITVGIQEKHEVVYKKEFWSGSDEVWVDGKLFKKRPICLSTKCKVTIGEQEKHEVEFICGLRESFSMKPIVKVDGVQMKDGVQASTKDDKPFSIVSPKIRNQRDAEMAIASGVTAGVISIIITAVITTLSFFGMKTIPGVDVTFFFDIAVVIILVLGLKAKSRISACTLVLYFILCKIVLFAANPRVIGSSMIVTFVILVMLMNGARGTFAYWKYSEQKPKKFSWKILLSTLCILFLFVLSGIYQEMGNAPNENEGRVYSFKEDTDIFIDVVAEPLEVFPDQQIMLNYDLYTRYDTRYEGFEYEGDMTMFWQEVIPTKGDNIQREVIQRDGKKYVRARIKRMALFPLEEGVFTIDPGVVSVSIADNNTATQPARIAKSLVTPKIEISVNQFPTNTVPENFTYSAGEYEISSAFDIDLNGVVIFTVTLTGVGNIRQTQLSEFDFGKDFTELSYEENVVLEYDEQNRVKGTKNFIFRLLPSHIGKLNLPMITFIYFDPNAASFEEIHTEPLDIDINTIPDVAFTVETPGSRLMLIFDVSGSMIARDYEQKTRLEIGRSILNKVVEKSAVDFIGLTVFASEMKMLSDFTNDKSNILDKVETAQTGIMTDGSAFGDTLYDAMKKLIRHDQNSNKQIIVVTDGSEDNATHVNSLLAAHWLADAGIPVHIVALFHHGEVPFSVDTPGIGERTINVVIDVEEDVLKEICKITGGSYYWVESEDQINSVIDDLIKKIS